MANCCICGSQIKAFTGVALDARKDLLAYQICDQCYRRKTDLTALKNLEENIQYFKRFLPSIMNEPTRSYVVDLVEIERKKSEEAQALADKKEEAIRVTARVENFMMTSGFEFTGWTVMEYKGFVSAETALGMGMFKALGASISNVLGVESEGLSDKLAAAKEKSMARLIEQSARKGANALIGADIDYTMFGDSLVGVIISGTAVVIERET
jgi:uncharacterized protein YbjQ (UPF0145 family)